jgi:hypothetical protein
MPIDTSISYMSPKTIYHHRWNTKDMPIDSPVGYMSPKVIYHYRWNLADMPIDGSVGYTSPKMIYHHRWNTKDLPVDSPTGYMSPKTIYHTRRTKSDLPVDGTCSYASPSILYHIRETESQLPVDSTGVYPTVNLLSHYNGPIPVDSTGNYPTINNINYNHGPRFNSAGSFGTLNYIEYDPDTSSESSFTFNTLNKIVYNTTREDNLATTSQNLHRIKYPVNFPDYLTEYYQTLTDVVVSIVGDYKVGDDFTITSLVYGVVDDYIVKNAQTLYSITYPLKENYKVITVLSMVKLLYTTPDDYIVAVAQTIRSFSDRISQYCKTTHHIGVESTGLFNIPNYTAVYSTLLNLQSVRTDLVRVSTTVSKTSLLNRVDKAITNSTVSNIKQSKIEQSIDYSTVQTIHHKCGTSVHCDNEELTWNDYCVDTTIDEYNMPVNIYGISKFRVTLYQHPVFDSFGFENELGQWLDFSDGSIVPKWTNECMSVGELSDQGFLNSDGTWKHNYPIGPGWIAISDIKAIRNNETTYPLSADDIIMETCNCRIDHDTVRGIIGTCSLSSVVNEQLVTDWTSHNKLYESGFGVLNEPMCFTFHLPEMVDIRYIDIAPASAGSWCMHAPGWVVIEGYYPGCRDWFVMSYEHTPNRYLTATDLPDIEIPWNTLNRTWTPGEYTRFPIVNGIRRHKPRQMLNRNTGRMESVWGITSVLSQCCDNNTVIMGLSARTIADDLRERCGDGLYGVGTGGVA